MPVRWAKVIITWTHHVRFLFLPYTLQELKRKKTVNPIGLYRIQINWFTYLGMIRGIQLRMDLYDYSKKKVPVAAARVTSVTKHVNFSWPFLSFVRN